jgi:hypothetical protein
MKPRLERAYGLSACLSYNTIDCFQRLLSAFAFSFNWRRYTKAWGPKKPLSNETIVVGAPEAGEIRLKVMSNALCHTDLYTLVGQCML